jgi:hypothetical protein
MKIRWQWRKSWTAGRVGERGGGHGKPFYPDRSLYLDSQFFDPDLDSVSLSFAALALSRIDPLQPIARTG